MYKKRESNVDNVFAGVLFMLRRIKKNENKAILCHCDKKLRRKLSCSKSYVV